MTSAMLFLFPRYETTFTVVPTASTPSLISRIVVVLKDYVFENNVLISKNFLVLFNFLKFLPKLRFNSRS